jgi:hypothetical protein
MSDVRDEMGRGNIRVPKGQRRDRFGNVVEANRAERWPRVADLTPHESYFLNLE